MRKEIINCCKFLVVVVILSLLLFGCASKAKIETAQKAKIASCSSPTYPFTRLQALASKFNVKWAVFGSDSRVIITKFYNTIMKTNVNPDTIGIYAEHGKPKVMLVMIKDSCVIETSEVSVELLYTLLNGEVI